MKMREAVTLWTPKNSAISTAGQATIRRKGAPRATGEEFFFSGGAAYSHVASETDFIKSSRWALIEFVTMVIRDGVDPRVAHAALLDIDEYAECLSLDTPGAKESDSEVDSE